VGVVEKARLSQNGLRSNLHISSNMIDNSDIVGHWRVMITANKNVIAAFQCPTPEDAVMEARRIVKKREARKLVSLKAVRQRLIRKSRQFGFEYGKPIEIDLRISPPKSNSIWDEKDF
jgi:hypothetical protein